MPHTNIVDTDSCVNKQTPDGSRDNVVAGVDTQHLIILSINLRLIDFHVRWCWWWW